MRRTPDSAQKQAIFDGASVIASIVTHHLEDRECGMRQLALNKFLILNSPLDNKSTLLAYYAVVLGLTALLLFEGSRHYKISMISSNIALWIHRSRQSEIDLHARFPCVLSKGWHRLDREDLSVLHRERGNYLRNQD